MSEQTMLSSITVKNIESTETVAGKDPQRLKDACSELESLFLYYLMKEMRETIPKSGLFGGGAKEEMYTGMLDLQLSREIASKREIGIASMLYGQFADENKAPQNVEKVNADNRKK